jgi:serine/threonine-protein kinase
MMGYVDPETLSSDPAPPEPQAPERLGRYELLFELASGGMGTVHAGRLVGEHGFDRIVAIKRVRHGHSTIKAFLAEARLGARITHPNVVQTLELGTDDHGAPFLVMQLIEGVSLAQLQRRMSARGEPMDCDLAAWMMAQAAAGLHAAHELTNADGRLASLVHRDVSPQNLLLSFDGRVYVTDFGIAKLYEGDGTESGMIKGKFAYMSPEQTRGAALDRRSDVFALGVVLWETLTGTHLFASGAPADTIVRVVNHEPDPPSAVRPEVPEELSSITLRALPKRADDRYATMADLDEALRGYLRGRSSAPDEHALAALLSRFFPDTKAELRDRLRAYKTGDSTPRASGPRAAVDPPQAKSTEISATASTVATPTQATKRWTASILIAGILLASAAIFMSMGSKKASQTSGTSSQQPPAPTASVAAPPDTATVSAVASSTPAPPPSTSAAPSSPSAPPTKRVHRPGRPKAGGAVSTTPEPPPVTSLPASAPYRSLDHN